MMCKDHQHKDARELIFQKMSHTSTTRSSIQDLETNDCLTKLQHSFTPPWNLSGCEKADLNLLESKEKVAMCQTPRESQTRSPDYLKKPSMNQRSTQQISAPTPQHAQYSDILRKYPQLQNWICLSLDLRMTMKRGSRNLLKARLSTLSRKRALN